MARPPKYKITEEDIDFLREVYPTGDWDAIKARFPGVPRSKIYHVVSANNITMDNYFWTQHDKDILIQYYNDIPTEDIKTMLDKPYTIRQIQNQAIKLGLTESREWTDNEINILLNNYEYMTGPEIQSLLPRKSVNAIYIKASQLGLQSGYVHKYYYTDYDRQFIIDNWGNMSDEEIANYLGRNIVSVMEQRRRLGLYYPKLDTTYYDVADYIRHNNQDWRKKSMEACGYQCILSGSKNFEIHHKYSFNMILKEAMQGPRWIAKDIKSYTEEEMLYILSVFKEYQDKYPLGICIDINIHKQFHAMYGNRFNTPEQWDEFVTLYYKHQ